MNWIELPPEQRKAIAELGGLPLRAVDPTTQTSYVLIPEELFARVRTLFVDEESQQFANDAYPGAMAIFGRDGWDDPAMDVYNDLDPRKPS